MPAITHFRGGVSNLGNTAGSTGTGYRQIVFVGSDNITLSQSTDGQNLTVSISGQSPAGGAFSGGVSTGGNTAGATGVTGTQLVFVGSDNITLSQTTGAGGGTISIIGAAGGAGDGFNRIAAGTQTAGTLATIKFEDSNGITFGMSQSTQITASHNGLTSQSNQAFSAGGGSSAFQTLNFADSNGVSFTNTNGSVAATVRTDYASSNHAHAFSAAGGSSNFTTLGFSDNAHLSFTNTNGSVAAVPIKASLFAVSNTTQSSSGTQNLSALSFQGNGIISAGVSNGSVVLSATQSNQAFSAGAASSTFQTLSFQDSNGLSWSNNAGAIRVTYTTPVVSNAVQSVGSATNSGTNTSRFAADDHVHAGVFSMGVSTGGNTSGDTRVDVGRFVFQGGNNITLSQITAANALNTVVISAGAGGGGNFSAGVSTGGNTAGSTGISGTRMVLVGTPNITLSQSTDANGNTITISANNPSGGSFSAGVSNLGNTAGSTGVTGTRLVFAGVDGVTLSQSTDANGATISIDDGFGTIHFWNRGNQKQQGTANQSVAPTPNQVHVSPLLTDGRPFENFMTIETLLLPVSITDGTATMSAAMSRTWVLGLYTLNGSTLSLLNSATATTGYAAAATNNSTGYAGIRWVSFHSSQWSAQPTLHPVSTYWMGVIQRTAGSSYSRDCVVVNYGFGSTTRFSGYVGVSQLTGNTQAGQFPFWGLYNTTTTAPPAAIQSTDINYYGTLAAYYNPFIQLGSKAFTGW